LEEHNPIESIGQPSIFVQGHRVKKGHYLMDTGANVNLVREDWLHDKQINYRDTFQKLKAINNTCLPLIG
jgi:hypothetical protein